MPNASLAQTIGRRIRERRQELATPLTQEQLAERIGVTQPVVSDWENGKATPTVPNLLKLVPVLELESLDDLVVDEPEPVAS